MVRSSATEPLDIVRRDVLPAIRPNLLASVRVAVDLIPDCRDRLDYGELTSALQIIGAIDWALDSGQRSLSHDGNR